MFKEEPQMQGIVYTSPRMPQESHSAPYATKITFKEEPYP